MNLPIAKLGCALLFSLQLIAQSVPAQRLDSLKHELELEKDHPNFWTLYEIAFEFIDREDFSTALDYVTQAKKVALLEGDSLKITKATRVRGQMLRKLERLVDAINELTKARAIAKRNNLNKEYYSCLNSLGIAYDYMGFYDLALETHFEGLNLSDVFGKDDAEQILNNIGFDYYKIGNYKKSKEYYFKALRAGKTRASLVYCNIAMVQLKMKQYSDAQISIKTSYELCNPNCTTEILSSISFIKGQLSLTNSKLSESKLYFTEAYSYARKMKSKHLMVDCLTRLADLSVNEKNYLQAERHLMDADAIISNSRFAREIAKLMDSYAILYQAQGDYRKSVIYNRKYIALNDSLMSQQMQARIMQINTAVEEKENTEKIAAQQQILRLNEEAIKRQQKLNLLVGAVATLLLFLAVILVKQVRDKNTLNTLLDRKVLERTKTLEDTVGEFVKRQSDMEQFILTTTKDIQSPLSSIKGLSHLFLADAGDVSATQENVRQLQCIIKCLAELHYRLIAIHKQSLSKIMPLHDKAK